MIRRIAKGLKHDPELAATLLKWAPKINNVVRGIMNATGQSEDDVVQDLLLKILTDTRAYRTNQIRLTPAGGKRQIWDIVEFSDGVYRLERAGEVLTIAENDERLSELRKCSLASFIFTGIIQHAHDVFCRFFQRRNGFADTEVESTRVFNRAKRAFVEVNRKGRTLAVRTVDIAAAYDVEDTKVQAPLDITKFKELVASPEGDTYIRRALKECGEDSYLLREIVAINLRYHNADQGSSRGSFGRRRPGRARGGRGQRHQGVEASRGA